MLPDGPDDDVAILVARVDPAKPGTMSIQRLEATETAAHQGGISAARRGPQHPRPAPRRTRWCGRRRSGRAPGQWTAHERAQERLLRVSFRFAFLMASTSSDLLMVERPAMSSFFATSYR